MELLNRRIQNPTPDEREFAGLVCRRKGTQCRKWLCYTEPMIVISIESGSETQLTPNGFVAALSLDRSALAVASATTGPWDHQSTFASASRALTLPPLFAFGEAFVEPPFFVPVAMSSFSFVWDSKPIGSKTMFGDQDVRCERSLVNCRTSPSESVNETSVVRSSRTIARQSFTRTSVAVS